MDVLWSRGRATVAQIVEALSRERLAYNTVLTLMRILEQKGYVRHEKEGRAFVYVPVVDRTRARSRAVQHLLRRFFDGSPELLMVNMLEHDQVDVSELERLLQAAERTQ
jgi:predicted transcriptional regulator